jgi:hypothetical protein
MSQEQTNAVKETYNRLMQLMSASAQQKPAKPKVEDSRNYSHKASGSRNQISSTGLLQSQATTSGSVFKDQAFIPAQKQQAKAPSRNFAQAPNVTANSMHMSMHKSSAFLKKSQESVKKSFSRNSTTKTQTTIQHAHPQLSNSHSRYNVLSQEEHEQVMIQLQKAQRHANTVIGPSSNAPIQAKSSKRPQSSVQEDKKGRTSQKSLGRKEEEQNTINELMQRYSKMPVYAKEEPKKSRNNAHQTSKTVNYSNQVVTQDLHQKLIS